MSLLGKLFGKKSPPSGATPTPTTPPSSDPSNDPNMIRVHDAYGQELFITKQVWRDSVLLDHIKKVWKDPNALYSTIVQALRDGFVADMLKPAQQLAAIDPDPERGAVVLAIVYRDLKRPGDSEKVLRRHIERHGESGVALTNLAKIYSAQKQDDRSLQTLWRGLELDPNQENGLGWYAAIFRESAGEPAALDAFRRVAALPGSWRARLWIARNALDRRQLDEALALYHEALSLAPRPIPTDFLQQLSGDLGNHGHLPEILQLVAPVFDIAQHGIAVGNNLIKAHLDLGQLDFARALMELHHAQKRADWKETLAFWDTELAKADVATRPIEPEGKISVSMRAVDDPIWLPNNSPVNELFPASTEESVRVAFLGSTAETTVQGDKPIHQISDAPGRLGRALPLFLAEQTRFHSNAQVRTIIPWLNGDSPAFVISGIPWKDDDAAQHARSGEPPSDYVVLTHLKATSEPWLVELRLIRTIDAKCLGSTTASLNVIQPEPAALQLASELIQLLTQHADLTPVGRPENYRVPTGSDFPQYLLRLEQLLAVRCSTMDGVPTAFLNGEREIIDGCVQLCVRNPTNVVTRAILAQILQRMKIARPQVVEESRDRVQLLQKEKPLLRPANEVLQRKFTEALTA